MPKVNNVYDATAYIVLRSKGKLAHKPSYFTVGGFTIPMGKTPFVFEWVRSYGDAILVEDGRYEMDFSLEEIDWDFIQEGNINKLNLLHVFRSIEQVRMDDIYYTWDKVLEDGTIESDAGHFFDVVRFEIEVYYKENGESKHKTFEAPQPLLDAYNRKMDKEWGDYEKAMGITA